MIKITLNNQLLNSLIKIEQNKTILENTKVPIELSNKFRKNTRKRSSYASNAIEGNPLSYEQAERAIESKNRHFLKKYRKKYKKVFTNGKICVILLTRNPRGFRNLLFISL